jgi:hypothetical protein
MDPALAEYLALAVSALRKDNLAKASGIGNLPNASN